MNSKNDLSDTEIISKLSMGESSQYFELLYKRYYSRVLDKCYSLVKNRNSAEELTEDIFSKVYEKLPSFKQLSSFSSWLYSITYNHCIDYLREKKKLHYPNWNRKNEIPEIIDETDEILRDLGSKLQERFDISHYTIQIERDKCGSTSCETCPEAQATECEFQ